MQTRIITLLLITGSLIGGRAAAQGRGPAEAGSVASPAATTPRTPAPDPHTKLERFLDYLENGRVVQLFKSRDGLGIRIGGIDRGAGLAAGPVWRESGLFDGRMQFHTSAAISIVGDRGAVAGVTFPDLITSRTAVSIGVAADHLAQERFYDPTPRAATPEYTVYAVDRRRTGLDVTVNAARWLRVTGGFGWAKLSGADAVARGVPGIASRWTALEAPGLGTPTDFAVTSVSATADRRDVPGNPRRGGRYSIRLERHADRSSNQFSFKKLDIELEEHFSWWRGERRLMLRTIAVLTAPDPGHDVPFYLQPTLGGSQYLRGFPTDRFRDRQMLLVQAEYGWDIWPFLGAVLFYETGNVAPDLRAMTWDHFRRDYGIGFRFGSARTIAVRSNVAFGSGEGTRFSMRFSHAF
jgi:hypothetical protein